MHFWYISITVPCFQKPSEIEVDSVDNVVKVGCTLHNYLRNNQILKSNADDEIEQMPEKQVLPCTHINSRNASSAFVVRQKFTDYFKTVGSIP
jgi:hypothetical protein